MKRNYPKYWFDGFESTLDIFRSLSNMHSDLPDIAGAMYPMKALQLSGATDYCAKKHTDNDGAATMIFKPYNELAGDENYDLTTVYNFYFTKVGVCVRMVAGIIISYHAPLIEHQQGPPAGGFNVRKYPFYNLGTYTPMVFVHHFFKSLERIRARVKK